MLKFKGRTYDVSDELIKKHGKYYNSPLEDWRIENYVRQREKNIDGNIEDILDDLSSDTVVSYIESGLKNEIAVKNISADKVVCQIENPKFHKED